MANIANRDTHNMGDLVAQIIDEMSLMYPIFQNQKAADQARNLYARKAIEVFSRTLLDTITSHGFGGISVRDIELPK